MGEHKVRPYVKPAVAPEEPLMMPLDNILAHPMTHGLGWSLVHFLWQATAIAGGLVIVMIAMRRSSPAARYRAACAALLLMAVAPLATIAFVTRSTWWTPADDAENLIAAIDSNPVTISTPAMPIQMPEEPARSGWCIITDHIARAIPSLVATWAAGVLVLSILHAGGWWRAQQLRRHGICEPAPRWVLMLERLSSRFNVRKHVRLLESTIARVPMVVGWLRPVILVPASALAGLTPAQLEAILAHELAHVKRNDYLVNLLQIVIETLLFYHPAVWWVSRRIRVERELCCDDLATALCVDRYVYAEALATVAELSRTGDGATPALAATDGPLVRRIRRILTGRDEHPVRSRPLAAAVTGVIAVALLAMTLTTADADPPVITTTADDSAEPTPSPSTRRSLGNVTIEPQNIYVAAGPMPASSPDVDPSGTEDELKDLVKAQLVMQLKNAAAQNMYEQIVGMLQEGMDPPQVKDLIDEDPTVRGLREQIASARNEVRLLEKRLGTNHPRYKSGLWTVEGLEKQLEEVVSEKEATIRAQLVSELRSQVIATQQDLGAINNRLNEIKIRRTQPGQPGEGAPTSSPVAPTVAAKEKLEFLIGGDVKVTGVYALEPEGKLTVYQAIVNARGVEGEMRDKVVEITRPSGAKDARVFRVALADLVPPNALEIHVEAKDLINVRDASTFAPASAPTEKVPSEDNEAAAPPGPTKEHDTGATVRPGDPLDVIIYDLEGPGIETVRQTLVNSSGTLTLPYVGRMPAAGKDMATLERDVVAAYQAWFPNVDARVKPGSLNAQRFGNHWVDPEERERRFEQKRRRDEERKRRIEQQRRMQQQRRPTPRPGR